MALTQISSDVVGTLANLTVSGNITTGNLSITPGGTVSRLNMITSTNTGQLRYASTGYRFEHNGTSLLTIADDGDLGVGLGVTNPGYKLHVADTSGYVDAAFQSLAGSHAIVSLRNQGTHYAFWGSDNITGSAFYGNSTANACIFGTTTTNNIQFVTNWTERVRILGSTGNVGINTLAPTEKLHVVGNAIVTGTVIGNVSGTANNASFLGGIPAANFANIASFANSLTMPGWQKLPGGLIIQWFTVAEGTTQGSVTANYPIAFPNAFLAASVSSTNNGASSNADMYFQFVSSTTTAITVYRQAVNNSANNGAMIIAIGY